MNYYSNLDLRGKLPKDTFQNLVQSSGSVFSDGHGNEITISNSSSSLSSISSSWASSSISASFSEAALSSAFASFSDSSSNASTADFSTLSSTAFSAADATHATLSDVSTNSLNSISSSFSILAGNYDGKITLERNIDVLIGGNNTIDIGSCTSDTGEHSFLVGMTSYNPTFSAACTAKVYLITSRPGSIVDPIYTDDTWMIVDPVSSTGNNSGLNPNLEAKVSGSYLKLRISDPLYFIGDISSSLTIVNLGNPDNVFIPDAPVSYFVAPPTTLKWPNVLSISSVATASYSLFAITSSYAITTFSQVTQSIISTSYADVAGIATSSISASYALIASNLPTGPTYNITVMNSVNSTNAVTAQTASFTLTSSFLNPGVYQVTSSYATIAGTANLILASNVSGNVATSSYSLHAINADGAHDADLATSAAYAVHAITASYSNTSSYIPTGTYQITAAFSSIAGIANAILASHVIGNVATASYAITSALSLDGLFASEAGFATEATYADSAGTCLSSSRASSSISSSYSLSSSYSIISSYSLSSSYALTASYSNHSLAADTSITSAWAANANIAASTVYANNAGNSFTSDSSISSSWASSSISASYALNGGSGGGTTFGFIQLPVHSAKLTISGSPSNGTVINSGDQNWELLFNRGDAATWQFMLPSNYDSSKQIVNKLSFYNTGSQGGVYNVGWNIYITNISSSTVDITPVSLSLAQTKLNITQSLLYSTGDHYLRVSSVSSSGAVFKPDDFIIYKLERAPNGGIDVAVGPIALIGNIFSWNNN